MTRPSSRGTCVTSTDEISPVAIKARRKSSTSLRSKRSPGLNRAICWTWRGEKGGWPVTLICAELRHRPRRHRQDQPRGLRLMVDDDVLFADPGGGEPPLAKRDLQRDAGVDHLLCDDRIAGLDRERLAQSLLPRSPRPASSPGNSTASKW